MLVIHLTLIALLYIPSAVGTPALSLSRDHVMHERRTDTTEWKPMRRVEGHTFIPLRIALKQSNLDVLPDFLLAVSDPSSTTYGNHWTPEKVVDIFSPAPETHNTVREWLKGAGVEESRIRTSRNRAWIEIQAATVDEAERLLQAEYHVFENEHGEQQVSKSALNLEQKYCNHHFSLSFVLVTTQRSCTYRFCDAHRRTEHKSRKPCCEPWTSQTWYT